MDTQDRDRASQAVSWLAGLLQRIGLNAKWATALAIGIAAASAFLLSGCGQYVKVYRPDGTVIVINPQAAK